MASIRIEIHPEAFNEYRNGPSVVGAMEEIANGIAERANGMVVFREDLTEAPYKVSTVHNSSRAVTFVSTNTIDGIASEAVNRTLTRAIP